MANHDSDIGDETANMVPAERGCMLCRIHVKVEAFSDLCPGDHICMPGRAPILGRLYKHHAIVASIENNSADDRRAELKVVDVDGTGKAIILCRCYRKPLPIHEHYLYDNNDNQVHKVALKKVVYRKRKFNKQDTIDRARFYYSHNQSDVKYCVCWRNCEHFACACVNGPDFHDPNDVQKLPNQSTSVQVHDCVWFFFAFLFWALQVIVFAFNFWMFAVFTKKDPTFEFLSSARDFRDFLNRTCYEGDLSPRLFHTTCDWKMMGIFVAFFVILFIILVILYYVPLYRKKLVCSQCFITVCINLLFSRLFAFIVVASMSIVMESPLYMLVTVYGMSRFPTVLMLIFIAAVGADLVYSLSSGFTRLIVWVCGKYYPCMEFYYEFVPLNGVLSKMIMRCLLKSGIVGSLEVHVHVPDPGQNRQETTIHTLPN